MSDRSDREEKVRGIVNEIYTAYGTDTGILFGLRADQKSVVATIVRCTLQHMEVADE